MGLNQLDDVDHIDTLHTYHGNGYVQTAMSWQITMTVQEFFANRRQEKLFQTQYFNSKVKSKGTHTRHNCRAS
jgi:hypothetical protein